MNIYISYHVVRTERTIHLPRRPSSKTSHQSRRVNTHLETVKHILVCRMEYPQAFVRNCLSSEFTKGCSVQVANIDCNSQRTYIAAESLQCITEKLQRISYSEYEFRCVCVCVHSAYTSIFGLTSIFSSHVIERI